MTIPNERPKKIWRGKKRKALKHISKRYIPIFEWAIAIQPGDWIATCEGTNRQVKDIEYVWTRVGTRTSVIFEVIFTDVYGNTHYCPGGGCALPKESISEIETYYKGWIEAVEKDPSCISHWDSEGRFKSKLEKMKERFDAGQSIVDGNGEFLPEFDHVKRN